MRILPRRVYTPPTAAAAQTTTAQPIAAPAFIQPPRLQRPPISAADPLPAAVPTPAPTTELAPDQPRDLRVNGAGHWPTIHRVEQYRMATRRALRLAIRISVWDSESRTYINWPHALSRLEVAGIDEPGLEAAKDLVWAVDELVEAIRRVGCVEVAQQLSRISAK